MLWFSRNTQRIWLKSVLALTMFSLGSAHGVASVRDSLPEKVWSADASGLCGVYAACSAIWLIGIDVNPERFVAKQYVGDCSGSSALGLSCCEAFRLIVDVSASQVTLASTGFPALMAVVSLGLAKTAVQNTKV